MNNIQARFLEDPVPLLTHRIASSDYYQATSLREIHRHWGLGDVADAHRMIDYLEEQEVAQQKNMPDPKDPPD